jgi:hypothetical protein
MCASESVPSARGRSSAFQHTVRKTMTSKISYTEWARYESQSAVEQRKSRHTPGIQSPATFGLAEKEQKPAAGSKKSTAGGQCYNSS